MRKIVFRKKSFITAQKKIYLIENFGQIQGYEAETVIMFDDVNVSPRIEMLHCINANVYTITGKLLKRVPESSRTTNRHWRRPIRVTIDRKLNSS